MPHGEIIGGRGKGSHPGPSDDLIFFRLQMICSVTGIFR